MSVSPCLPVAFRLISTQPTFAGCFEESKIRIERFLRSLYEAVAAVDVFS